MSKRRGLLETRLAFPVSNTQSEISYPIESAGEICGYGNGEGNMYSIQLSTRNGVNQRIGGHLSFETYEQEKVQ